MPKARPIKHRPKNRGRLPELPISRVQAAMYGRSDALLGVDPNHPRMQRLAQLTERLIVHLGGPDNVTFPESALAGRASMKLLLCEILERSFIHGKKIRSPDLLRYLALTQSLRRDFVTLGFARRAKEVESVGEYLRDNPDDEYMRRHANGDVVDAGTIEAPVQ